MGFLYLYIAILFCTLNFGYASGWDEYDNWDVNQKSISSPERKNETSEEDDNEDIVDGENFDDQHEEILQSGEVGGDALYQQLYQAIQNRNLATVKTLVEIAPSNLNNEYDDYFDSFNRLRREDGLFLAMDVGAPKIALFLLRNNGDPNAVDQDGMTLIDVARERNYKEIQTCIFILWQPALREERKNEKCEEEFEENQKANDINIDNVVPSYHALTQKERFETEKIKDFAEIEQRLQNHVDINKQNSGGETALHLAAKHGQIQSIQKLCNEDANLEVRDNYGCTALHHAARCGQVDAIEVLRDRGAVITACDNKASTALHYAASEGHIETIKILKNFGINIEAVDREGSTALIYAVRTGRVEAIRILKEELGANLSVRNNSDYTALSYATLYGKLEVIKVLKELGCDFSDVDLIHYAVRLNPNNNQFEIMKLLLDEKANPNDINHINITPLHHACIYKNMKIIKLLLDHNAQPGLLCNRNIGFASYGAGNKGYNINCMKGLLAFMEEHAFYKKFLYGPNPNETLLKTAIRDGYIEIIRMLLQCNVSPNDNYNPEAEERLLNTTYSNRNLPIHLAAQHSNLEAIQLLIEYGAMVNKQNNLWQTPLHIAVLSIGRRTFQSIVRVEPYQKLRKLIVYLLDHEADPNLQALHEGVDWEPAGIEPPPLHWNVLHVLCTRFEVYPDILVRLLENCNNDFRVVDYEGNTPLHLLVMHALAENTPLLLQDIFGRILTKGIDLKQENAQGQSVLGLIAQYNSFELFDYLIKHGFTPREDLISYLSAESNSLLHFAVAGGSLCMMQALVGLFDINNPNNGRYERLVDWLNAANQNGVSLLMRAVAGNHLDIIRFLLQQGVNVNARNLNGKTACYLAAEARALEILKLFLENGSLDAAHIAIEHGDLETLKVILECAKTVGAGNPVNIAQHLNVAQPVNVLNLINALHVINGANILDIANQADSQGNTPLIACINHAARDTQEQLRVYNAMIRLLWQQGARMNIIHNGRSVFQHAIIEGVGGEVLESLIRCAEALGLANITDPRDPYGNSLLMLCVMHAPGQAGDRLNRYVAMIDVLINNAVRLNVGNLEGDTVLHQAIRRGVHDEVLQRILQACRIYNQRIRVANQQPRNSARQIPLIHQLINAAGQTPLQLAQHLGNQPMVDALIEYGLQDVPAVQVQQQDQPQPTPRPTPGVEPVVQWGLGDDDDDDGLLCDECSDRGWHKMAQLSSAGDDGEDPSEASFVGDLEGVAHAILIHTLMRQKISSGML